MRRLFGDLWCCLFHKKYHEASFKPGATFFGWNVYCTKCGRKNPLMEY